jgi:ribosomal protein L7/L12
MRPEGLSRPLQPHHAGKKENNVRVTKADELAVLTDLVVEVFMRNAKIQCITRLRRLTELEYSEAKDLVDAALSDVSPRSPRH